MKKIINLEYHEYPKEKPKTLFSASERINPKEYLIWFKYVMNGEESEEIFTTIAKYKQILNYNTGRYSETYCKNSHYINDNGSHFEVDDNYIILGWAEIPKIPGGK